MIMALAWEEESEVLQGHDSKWGQQRILSLVLEPSQDQGAVGNGKSGAEWEQNGEQGAWLQGRKLLHKSLKI